MERIRQIFFGHPLAKALGLGLFGILGNVLAGAYVFEITRQGPSGQFIDWPASAQSRSFWLLLGVLLLMGLYGWGTTRFETRARKALIEVAKKDIMEGKIRSIDDLKRMFGTGDRQQ